MDVGPGGSPFTSSGDVQEPGASPKSKERLVQMAREAQRAEAERVEFVESAAGREERGESRSAFAQLSDIGALELLRREFGSEVAPLGPDAETLLGGDRVVEYMGDYLARVDGTNGRPDRIIESQIPHRTPETGEVVDLDLVRSGDGYVPDAGVTAVELSLELEDGLVAGGLRATPAGDAEAVRLDADTLAYPNSQAATDVVVNPTTSGGFETFHQLRGPDSPESHRIEVELPDGSRLSPTSGGGAEVVNAVGDVKATISAPVAVDAQGTAVPVELSVDGNDVVLVVQHHHDSFAYPILVDPEFTPKDDWACSSGPSCTATWFHGHGGALMGLAHWSWWQDAPSNAYLPHTKCVYGGTSDDNCYGHAHGGGSNWNLGCNPNNIFESCNQTGLHIKVRPGVPHAFGKVGRYAYVTPGGATTQIYRADFGAKFLRNRGGLANPMMFTGIYSFADWDWVDGTPGALGTTGYIGDVTHNWNANFGSTRGGPQAAAFGFIANGDQRTNNFWRDGYVGAAIIQLTDPEVPTFTNPGQSGPTGWSKDGTWTFAPTATDPGLGMRRFRLAIPAQTSVPVQDRWVWCLGAKGAPCPATHTLSASNPSEDPLSNGAFRLRAASIPSGQHTVSIKAADALGTGHEQERTATIKVDRQRPSATLSGIQDGELLRDRDYVLQGSMSDAHSGAKSVTLKLDGNVLASRTDCPATTAACTVGATLDGGASSLAAGEHTLLVTATDQATNVETKEVKFQVERTAPVFEAAGSLRPPEGPWVMKGEQDLFVDAFDAGTGVTHAELLVDGQVRDSVDRECAGGGCDLTFDPALDTTNLSEGGHTVAVKVRDGAGNEAPVQQWPIKLERTAPSLTVSGPLKDAANQQLQAGQTYPLTASATDSSLLVPQSGLTSLEMSVDGDPVKLYQQGCPDGECGQTANFTFVVDEHESGSRVIEVTATDLAGNETTESFTVGNPEGQEPACNQPPTATTVPSTGVVSPAVAETSLRSRVPAAFEGSSTHTLVDEALKPVFGGSDPLSLLSSAGLADAAVNADAQGAALSSIYTSESPNCVRPTSVGAAASAPVAIEGSGVLYANSAPVTDTLIRATGSGLASVLQLRTNQASNTSSWNMSLDAGQRLEELSDGRVALVESAGEGALAPPNEPVSALPSTGEREQALSNTATQLQQASDDLERAQQGNTDRVVAVIPKPWAKDANNSQIATTMSATGSTITMSLNPGAGVAYPVTAGYTYTTRDAVDDYETLATAESIPDDASDDEATVTPTDTDPAPAESAPTTSDDYFGDDGAGSSEDGGPPVEDAGAPELAEASRTLTQAGVNALTIGVTAGDPGTITDPEYATNAGSLQPEAVRPFAPWNSVSRPDTTNARLWNSWFNGAKARGIRGDVAITRDAETSSGGTGQTKTLRNYRTELRRFLRVYGGRNGVVSNLMAWNEPNFRGNQGSGDPFRDRPAKAAQLWIAAMKECFPQQGQARCVHQDSSGAFKRSRVIAGEFTEADRKRRWPDGRGKRPRKTQRYSTVYNNEINRVYRNRRNRRPRVWSFHDYGDFRRHELTKGKAGAKAAVLAYYSKQFASEPFRIGDGDGAAARPDVWLSEGGASYTFHCRRLTDDGPNDDDPGDPQSDRDRACGGQSDRVALFGMGKQRNALAFMLKRIVQRYPKVRRFYNFNFHSRNDNIKCRESRRTFGVFRCDLDERGLLGTLDDPRYVGRLTSDPGDLVSPLGGSAADYSAADNDRRLAFCLLRARNARQIGNPRLVTRTSCPAQ